MELNKLRPEVRSAIRDLAIAARLRPEYQQPVGIIYAELLRLAEGHANLIASMRAAEPINRDWRERAKRAEAELAALKARIACG